jgi:hypothetical protein
MGWGFTEVGFPWEPMFRSFTDLFRYDNCFSTSNVTMVDNDSEEAQSPARFQKMAASLDAQSRDFQFFICQWGIGENVGDWYTDDIA